MREQKLSAYQQKLLDPRWQRKRLEILQRDEWKCQQCGDEKTTLQVHHRYYERSRDPWDYPQDGLVTLCEPCHKDETLRRKVDDPILQALSFCPRIGRRESAEFTVTLLLLLLRTVETYDTRDPDNLRGHAQFRLQDLALFTGQTIETIESHIMTMCTAGYMQVGWRSDRQEWQHYTFNINAFLNEGWQARAEDRRSGNVTFQDS